MSPDHEDQFPRLMKHVLKSGSDSNPFPQRSKVVAVDLLPDTQAVRPIRRDLSVPMALVLATRRCFAQVPIFAQETKSLQREFALTPPLHSATGHRVPGGQPHAASLGSTLCIAS